MMVTRFDGLAFLSQYADAEPIIPPPITSISVWISRPSCRCLLVRKDTGKLLLAVTFFSASRTAITRPDAYRTEIMTSRITRRINQCNCSTHLPIHFRSHLPLTTRYTAPLSCCSNKSRDPRVTVGDVSIHASCMLLDTLFYQNELPPHWRVDIKETGLQLFHVTPFLIWFFY